MFYILEAISLKHFFLLYVPPIITVGKSGLLKSLATVVTVYLNRDFISFLRIKLISFFSFSKSSNYIKTFLISFVSTFVK